MSDIILRIHGKTLVEQLLTALSITGTGKERRCHTVELEIELEGADVMPIGMRNGYLRLQATDANEEKGPAELECLQRFAVGERYRLVKVE